MHDTSQNRNNLPQLVEAMDGDEEEFEEFEHSRCRRKSPKCVCVLCGVCGVGVQHVEISKVFFLNLQPQIFHLLFCLLDLVRVFEQNSVMDCQQFGIIDGIQKD